MKPTVVAVFSPFLPCDAKLVRYMLQLCTCLYLSLCHKSVFC